MSASATAYITCGVTQDLMLGPSSLWMLPLGHTMSIMFILPCWQHAVTVCLPLRLIQLRMIECFNPLRSCFKDIKCWIHQHFQQLNKSKNEIVLFGQPWTCMCAPLVGVFQDYKSYALHTYSLLHFWKFTLCNDTSLNHVWTWIGLVRPTL